MKFTGAAAAIIFSLSLALSGGITTRVSASLATPTPTPQATQSPSPTPSPVQTLEMLQSRIRSKMFAPQAVRARVGIKVVSLATGKVVFENDAEKYFVPASNMKNFTVAAALEQLGPDFKFVTSVYAAAAPDQTGTINGDLRVYGRGDVSMSTFFATKPATDPEVYYERIDRLVDRIAAAGVKRVNGGLVADEGYFTGYAIPLTWEWDDLQWYDGAEVSAFPVNNNAVDLVVRGTAAGQPCNIAMLPAVTLYQITNLCTTGGSKQGIVIKKALDRNILTVSGSMPAGEKWSGAVTFTHMADLFAAMLKERLEKRGITVAGTVRTISTRTKNADVEIARLESPPFREIAAKTMKPSQNMYTETILWTLGEEVGRKNGASGESSQLGLGVMRGFMTTAGIPADAVVQYDGSGLSRHNLVTPSAIVQLYTFMSKAKSSQAWRDSLAIGGIDGTLRRRFAGTSVAGNFRGKTGTLDQVSALSGYVTTAGGEQLVVSIMVNGIPVPAQRVALIDAIVLDIANFNGKVDQ